MFWRKPRRSPEAQLVAGIFGDEMARTYEGFAQSPGQQDIANLYLATVAVAQRFPQHRTQAVSRLHRELQALAQAHPTERDSALLGYSGLTSVLDKGILTAMDAGLFLTLGEQLTGRAPLHAWAPVAAWRQQLPSTMDPAARMWAWHHLASCFALNINGFSHTFNQDLEHRDALVEPAFARLMLWARLSAYRDGWMRACHVMPALSPEQHAAALGLETLYERLDGGRAVSFQQDLVSAAPQGQMRNHIHSIHEVLTARGDTDLIPAFVREQEQAGPGFTALVSVQTLVEVNLAGAAEMGRESAGVNLAQYQREVVMRDPLTVLLTNG